MTAYLSIQPAPIPSTRQFVDLAPMLIAEDSTEHPANADRGSGNQTLKSTQGAIWKNPSIKTRSLRSSTINPMPLTITKPDYIYIYIYILMPAWQ